MDKLELKNVGLKVTLPRVRVLKLFEDGNKRHLSADDIFKRLNQEDEDIAMATVYRVLSQFETAGLIIRHNFEGDSAVFELNEGEHHDHLVCIKCDKVEEFIDPTIEARQNAVAKQAGFQITDHSLNIYGLCRDCC